MSWRDRNNPWRRKQRRQVLMMSAAACLFLTFAVVISCVVHSMNVSRNELLGGLVTLLAWTNLFMFGPAILMVIFSIVFAVRALRERRVLKLVPEHDGLVCPRCRIPAEADNDDARCRKCDSRWPIQELKKHWEQFGLDRLGSRRELAEFVRPRRPSRSGGTHRLLAAMRDKPHYAVGAALAVWLLLVALGTILRLGDFFAIAGEFLPWLFILLSSALAAAGTKRRVGDEESCAACGYSKTPGADSGPRCPECGSDWELPGGTVRGRIRSNRALMVIGWIMLGAAVLSFSPRFIRGSVRPTSWLITDIVSEQSRFGSGAWQEIQTRTLSAEQRIELAEGLLNRRKGGNLTIIGEKWLDDALFRGLLPRTLVDRYYSEMVDLWLVGPHQGRMDQSLTVGLAAEDLDDDSDPLYRKRSQFVIIQGYYVGDSTEPIGRRNDPLNSFTLENRWHDARRLDPTTGAEPQFTFAPTATGEINIRLVAWIVYAPDRAFRNPVTWREDDTPILPDTTIWSGRFVMEHIVNVKD